MAIAESRDWQAISVTGTPEFRREIWREASLRGLRYRRIVVGCQVDQGLEQIRLWQWQQSSGCG